MSDKTYVTKSFLPPREEYDALLDGIWERGQLTNQGPLLKDLEQKISEYVDVEGLHIVGNGTIALQLALRALDIDEGEVITTPFSYVATTSSVLWERCRPVFVDIEPETFCIDVSKIEAAITERTRAIMPVHVFGFPCDVEAIDRIAKKHNLKVIYDAAHAFGVKVKGKSLLDNGDISTCSFHSTKPFHMIEGGCVIVRDEKVSENVELMKRFGHDGDQHKRLGINAKVSEFQAAMGLSNLPYFNALTEKRRILFEMYGELLGAHFKVPQVNQEEGYEHNYAYYPILFRDEAHLMRAFDVLGSYDIYPRRYFYPSLNKLPYLEKAGSCPVSEDIASRIACLPLYADLPQDKVRQISKILIEV